MQTAKKIVNSLFNGARLSPSTKCALYRMLDFDREAMSRLQADPEVQRLRTSIKTLWRCLALTFRREFKTGSQKWSLYFACERQIMDVVTVYLHARHVRHFTEHDGFRASKPIDATDLSRAVFEHTGFNIEFEQKD